MAFSSCSPYEMPRSLWSVIELYAPTVELPEIKHIIGEDLIQQSDELFDEIHMLLDIWQSEASEPIPLKKSEGLAESPIIREKFVSQIQHFLNNLDATKNHMLQSFISERRNVYNYATQPQSGRSSVSSSHEGRLTPSRPNSRSSQSADISIYRDNISAFQIDKIVSDIQGAFRDEHRVLKEDIEFLHQALEQQHDSKDGGISKEPSLNELKVFADELEKRVIDLSQPVFASISHKKPSSPVLKSLPNAPKKTKDESSKMPSASEIRALPSLSAATSSKLSWRQRTLKKVNLATQRSGTTFLQEVELRGNSPGAQREALMLPKPPPPRNAFEVPSTGSARNN